MRVVAYTVYFTIADLNRPVLPVFVYAEKCKTDLLDSVLPRTVERLLSPVNILINCYV